ncbi:WSD1 family O-acyltransferase [Couchioplanes caeruleus]|uniref:WSD1 family O-acyltransferase n=1 Tax=Couchioplanes caeruleus TaxID=56438 RepID=UPI0020BF818E|nr:WSD1 family O-acyltransferase [Couchioplanes caeruleus]UQU61843.1 WSD1 family O-acyltransferase [Couchioplanes caeruleus]
MTFQAITYAGTLAVSAVADPRACPDLPVLGAYLAEELAALGAGPAPGFGTFCPARPIGSGR